MPDNIFERRNVADYKGNYFVVANCGYVGSSKKQPLEVFYRQGVLKNFAKVSEKDFCQQSLFFNKIAVFRPEQNTSGRMLLFLLHIITSLLQVFFHQEICK